MRKDIPAMIICTIMTLIMFIIAASAEGEGKTEQRAHVVINEVCSNNFCIADDDGGNYYDYVELYNSSDIDSDFDIYLSDDQDDLKKYRVEESVPAKGFLLIWLSGTGNEEHMHAGFKASKDGETLFLTDDKGNTLDIVDIPALEHDKTYSRTKDGGKRLAVTAGTPNASNEGAVVFETEFIESPVFSLDDGFYSVGTQLTIQGEPFTRIYYTLDGTVPDKNALLYKEPITLEDASDRDNIYANEMMYVTYTPPNYKLDKANVVRAVAVDILSGKRSRVVTHTYFCGFESKEIYKDVKIISLFIEPEDAFGYDNGIFAMGKAYDEYKKLGGFSDLPDSEVPASFELDGHTYYRYTFTNSEEGGRVSEREAKMSVFDSDHDLSFVQNIGVRVAGESTRSEFQKSLNLYARDIYDDTSTFKESFFYEDGDRVRLRRSDERMWFQEPMLHRIYAELGMPSLDSQMEAVFINGEYWGVYNLRERFDENYFIHKLDMPKEYIWEIKNDYPEFGGQDAMDSYTILKDMINYIDLSTSEEFENLDGLCDVDNLINYFCAQIYFDCEDITPTHNQILWRSAVVLGDDLLDSRWRWLAYDLDHACIAPDSNTIELYRDLREGDYAMYLPGELYENEEFRNRFRTRMEELINTTFSYDHLHKMLTEYDSEYRQQIIASVSRFEGIIYTEADYEKDLSKLDDFFKERGEYVIKYLDEDMEEYAGK